MYDSRFPWMTPVDGRPLPGLSLDDARSALRVALSVCSRTGTRCFYNTVTGKLLFVYGNDPDGGPLQVPFRRLDGIEKYTTTSTDAMVEYIRLGLLARREKDRIAEQNDRAEKQEKEKLGQKFRDDVRSDVLSYAAFLDRRRRGVASHIVAL